MAHGNGTLDFDEFKQAISRLEGNEPGREADKEDEIWNEFGVLVQENPCHKQVCSSGIVNVKNSNDCR